MPGIFTDMPRLSFRLGLSVSVIALSAAVSASAAAQPAPATAPPQEAQGGGAIETVVVTAEKRSENVQEVGMSITAFSS